MMDSAYVKLMGQDGMGPGVWGVEGKGNRIRLFIIENW